MTYPSWPGVHGPQQPVYWVPPQPPAPDPRPGRNALTVALFALGISLVLSFVTGSNYAAITAELGENWDAANLPEHLDRKMTIAAMAFLGQLVPTVMGIAGFAMGIGAASKPGSKGSASWAILVAVLAPVVTIIYLVTLIV